MPNKENAGVGLKRLHDLVRLLRTGGDHGVTLEEIYTQIYHKDYPECDFRSDAFKRKFHRDREALKNIYGAEDSDENQDPDENDIEIYKKNGRFYMKSRYIFMLPIKVQNEELQALISGIKLAGHFIKPLESFAETLWKTLKKQFPASVMEQGERLGQMISFDIPVSKMDAGHKVFQKVVRAIDEKKALKVLSYEHRDGTQAPCTISPYALYLKYHAWYLMGTESPSEGESSPPKVFRLNRMRSVEVLENGGHIECPFTPEELRENIELDYDPDSRGKDYHVKLRITGRFARAVMETKWFRGEKKNPEQKPNREFSVQYEVRLKGLERIILWIMRALDCVEVLEPQELREEIDRRVAVYLKRKKENVT
jgi:predicted DNA-binding transcriptional regulator YafY